MHISDHYIQVLGKRRKPKAMKTSIKLSAAFQQLLNTFGASVQYIPTSKSHVSHVSCVTLHHHNLPADWAR